MKTIFIDKNKKWIDSLHKSIDNLDEDTKTILMTQVGKSCVSDILELCEANLGQPINTVQNLIDGWNLLRKSRGLKGQWVFDGNLVQGLFKECGCPLVRSGLIDLHPNQCRCSKGMLETIFSEVAKKESEVLIRRSIGNGDNVCEFIVKI